MTLEELIKSKEFDNYRLLIYGSDVKPTHFPEHKHYEDLHGYIGTYYKDNLYGFFSVTDNIGITPYLNRDINSTSFYKKNSIIVDLKDADKTNDTEECSTMSDTNNNANTATTNTTDNTTTYMAGVYIGTHGDKESALTYERFGFKTVKEATEWLHDTFKWFMFNWATINEYGISIRGEVHDNPEDPDTDYTFSDMYELHCGM